MGLLTSPAASTLHAPLQTTAQQEGKIRNIFTLKRQEPESDVTVPTAAPSQTPKDKEENIAGVGAEILTVAEGIRSLVQLWDEKVTKGTEGTEELTTAAPFTAAHPSLSATSLVTGPAGIENMTADSTGGAQSPLETGQPVVFPVPTGPPPVLWNRTRVLLQQPVSPPPGSDSFPFSPGDDAIGEMMAFQESFSRQGQEGAAILEARAAWGAASKKRGEIVPTANILDQQELTSSASMHDEIPAEVAGSLDNQLSHYVRNSNHSVSHGNTTPHILKNADSSQSMQSIEPSDKQFGKAVADLNRSHSDSVSNATNFVDFFPANNSDSLGFDLLTYTMQLYSNNSTGLASFFPGLTPTAGHCLPLPANLPYCNNLGLKHFRMPNYFNHGSDMEIRASLHEWEGLLKSRCHRYLEWFYCLLLVPGCNASIPITPPPCQGFCEALKDLCWMHLKEGHLPISCDSLPAEDNEYSCVFINVSAGNNDRGNICYQLFLFLPPGKLNWYLL